MQPCRQLLLAAPLLQSVFNGTRMGTMRFNSCRAAVTRIHRKHYAQMYPTMLVFPNGSTVTIRHKEPRAIIKLPIDLSSLSETERAMRLARRKPKKTFIVEEELDDSFDVNKYSHLWKKK